MFIKLSLTKFVKRCKFNSVVKEVVGVMGFEPIYPARSLF